MKTKNIITTIILIIIAGTLLFLLLRPTLTGQAIVKDYYTYTKAICDENNFCQDYEIVCENKQVTQLTPIAGAVIQHNPNWEDPRINKSEIKCE